MRKIEYAIVHHTAHRSKRKITLDQFIFQVSAWHKLSLHRRPNGNGNHIAYHYLINKDGDIANTRPIEEIGYHCGNWSMNKRSVGICLEWDFRVWEEAPTKAQLKTLERILALLDKGQRIKAVLGHRDVRATECPGYNLYKHILNHEKYGDI